MNCEDKVKYTSAAQASEIAKVLNTRKKNRKFKPYKCKSCAFYHLHTKADGKKLKFKKVKTRALT